MNPRLTHLQIAANARPVRLYRCLLLAEAVLLTLILGSVGVATAWLIPQDTVPAVAPAAAPATPVEVPNPTAAADTDPCIVQHPAAATDGKTCISVN